MKPSKQHLKQVATEYDHFLKDAESLSSTYGRNEIYTYLTLYRARISSQIAIQLGILEKNKLSEGSMLSLGGWPGVAPIILNRLTGISGTLLDHPALLTKNMESFYNEHGLKTIAFDFSDASTPPIPLSDSFQMIECCQCIEHWNFSPIPVFRHLFSTLLAPDGHLLVTVPNATSLYRRLATLGGRTPYPSMDSFIDVDRQKAGAEVSPHWREYTARDLQDLITHTGGCCSAIRSASYPIAGTDSMARSAYSFLNNIHSALRENIEVVCQIQE